MIWQSLRRRQIEKHLRSAKTDFSITDEYVRRVITAIQTAPVPPELPATSKAVLRRARRLRPMLALAALAAGLIAYGPARQWIAPGPPLVVVASVRGPASGRGHALRVGDRLPAGCVVRTGAGGRVTLFTRRGSELTLNAQSELRLRRDRRADLRRGQVYCRNREHEIAQIRTPAGRIELLGTELDAAVKDARTTTVVVLEGKVRLTNAHGDAVIAAGRRAVLTAEQRPDDGGPLTSTEQLAWYDGRVNVVSDQGQIVYTVRRNTGPGAVLEVWAMNADGSGKHLVKSYLGYGHAEIGQWLAGSPWIEMQIGEVFDLQRRSDLLLNVITGEELPLRGLENYLVQDPVLSPDGNLLVFSGMLYGAQRPETEANSKVSYGLFVYDFDGGSVRRLYSGDLAGKAAWEPGAHRALVAVGDSPNSTDPKGDAQRLVLIDADNGEVADLGISATDASFSPDGKHIAYRGSWRMDYFDHDAAKTAIVVLDLGTAQPPHAITPEGEGASGRVAWSPDGTRRGLLDG